MGTLSHCWTLCGQLVSLQEQHKTPDDRLSRRKAQVGGGDDGDIELILVVNNEIIDACGRAIERLIPTLV